MSIVELIENAQRAYRSMDLPVFSEAQFIWDFIEADVAPVRCKDCKYYHEMEEGFFDCIHCFGIDFPQELDFCSYGKKKTEE